MKSASERFPQVEHFSSTYRAACRKREFAEWLAEKARAAEREQRPADALEAWNAVHSVHPAYPELDAKIAGLKQENGVGSDYERRHDLIYQIRNAIATSEFAGALHLIQSAGSSLESEPEFAELRAAAENGAERERRAGHLLDDAAQLTSDRRYDEAIRKLDEASGLNVRAREIAAARNYVLIEQAQSLFDTDPDRAEALLKQSLEFAPGRDTAHKLLELLEERNRRERITETTHRMRGVEAAQAVRIPAPAAEEKAAEIPVVASVVALAEKTPGSIITPPSFSFDTRPGLLQLVRRHRVKGVAMAFLGGTVAAAIVLAVMFPRHDRHKGVQPALTPQGSTGSAVHPGASVPRPAVSASASTPSVAEAKVAQAVPTVNDEAPLGTAPAPIPLPPAIHIETDFQSGSVLLDDERAGALEGGQFSQNIAKGSHSISVLPAAGGRYNFAFTLGKDGEWTLSAPKSSGYGTPILVALSSVRTRIVCGRSGLLVKLDDRRPAACTPAGMELPAVSEGNHTVALSDGLRTLAVHTLTYETTPVLTALVTTGAQFGGLAIRGSEDTFDVAVNGYTSKRPAKAGHWRRLLKPGDYTIAISKPGFVANPSTLNVSVTPGSDTLEQVAFTPIPARARLRLISEPGTEVTLNGKPAGTVSESGTLDLGQLPIGSADLRLHHHGFIDSQQTLSLVAGENERTIFLQQLKARVTWSVDPANAQLTYGPIGNSIRHPLTGNLIELPAGTYDFEVSAPGHLTASSVVTVAAGETRNISLRLEPAYPVLRTVDAWPGWQAQSGWLVREKAGPTFHNLPEHVSRVAFSAQWDRQKTLVHWSAGPLTVVFRSTDLSRLVIFRITEHGIFWTAAVQGKRQEGRVPLNLAKNSEMIQADIRPGGIALTVNGNALPAVGPNLFAESKPLQFGFIVEQDQVVRLSDIRIAARMISN
ncbi:MAG: PEGA domain-containing protein [Acidobacteriaceae bacterium]|nr:PEGA domain-containing protein [Acidobacteriaceae bacterium]